MSKKSYTFVNKEKFDALKDDVGDLQKLETDEKSSVVAAINEAASTGGGYVFGGKDLPSNITKTDNTSEVTRDNQFPMIVQASSSSESYELFTADVDKAIFGKYAVILRLKSSVIGYTDNIIKVESYAHNKNTGSDTLISTINIKGTAFSTENKFKTIGFNTEYEGANPDSDNLRIKATLLSNSSDATISIDYIIVSYAYTAIASL